MIRTIVTEARSQFAATYTFDDSSVVWVCFKPSTKADAKTYENRRGIAQRFLDNLNPKERWEGKIDGEGRVIESPIKLD